MRPPREGISRTFIDPPPVSLLFVVYVCVYVMYVMFMLCLCFFFTKPSEVKRDGWMIKAELILFHSAALTLISLITLATRQSNSGLCDPSKPLSGLRASTQAAGQVFFSVYLSVSGSVDDPFSEASWTGGSSFKMFTSWFHSER